MCSTQKVLLGARVVIIGLGPHTLVVERSYLLYPIQ
jgi:hypothetical protein